LREGEIVEKFQKKKCFKCIYLYFFNQFELLVQYISTSIKIQHFESSVESVITAGWIARLTKRPVINIFSWGSVKYFTSFKKCFKCIYLYFFDGIELLFQYILTSFIKIQHFESSIESVITAGWIAQLTKRPVINIFSWSSVKVFTSFKKCFKCIYLYFFNGIELLLWNFLKV